jgi:peroxiredoxin
MRPDIIPGAVFPDYELSDHRGMHRTLSELQEGDPLVLVLSRGDFCPKERRQHEGLLLSVRKNAGAGVGRAGLIMN